MTSTDILPAEVDTLVVGGGTAGCVIAGRLAEATSESILLVEAGPDYGPADSGRWPEDLMDATSLAMWSHDWGYTGEYAGQTVRLQPRTRDGGLFVPQRRRRGVREPARLRRVGGGRQSRGSTDGLLPLFDLAWNSSASGSSACMS